MSWWLLANVFVAVTLCRSRGWSLILLLPALLNGLCIVSKSGLKISDISPSSIKDYVLANLTPGMHQWDYVEVSLLGLARHR